MKRFKSISLTRFLQISIITIIFILLLLIHPAPGKSDDKEDTEELMKRGNQYLDEGEYTKAMMEFKDLLEIDPENPFALNNLGLTYKEKELYSSAKKSFEKALEILPNYYKALNNLGNLYFEMEEYERAQEYYEKSLEIKPNFPEAHWNLALCYEKSGESILALREWRRFISSDEENVYVPLARKHISEILEKLDE